MEKSEERHEDPFSIQATSLCLLEGYKQIVRTARAVKAENGRIQMQSPRLFSYAPRCSDGRL